MLRKLAVGVSTAALFLTAAAPTLAATAYNYNVKNGGWAKAKAIEKKEVYVTTMNMGTFVVSGNIALANSGVNDQSKNEDGNVMKVEGSGASGETLTTVNYTSVTVK